MGPVWRNFVAEYNKYEPIPKTRQVISGDYD